jgi:hypothetical protein
MDIPYPR